jgi:outer membrane protein OmpA-like peptidoglycan-associated protein
MKTLHYLSLVASAALFAGCAAVAPNELVNARSAYQVASQGPAQQLVPAELHKAHEALNLAEQSFQKEPDSYKTKDLAYVAQRKSEQAAALGSIAASRTSKDNANSDFQHRQSDIVKQGKQDLSASEKRTTDARAEIDKQAALKAARDKADADYLMQQAKIEQGRQELGDSQRQTAAALAESEKQSAVSAAGAQAELEKQAAVNAAQEKAAREKAATDLQRQQADIQQGKQDLKNSEKRTADAIASLNALASVKQEERGLVLTLSGSILFRSAKSDLMPNAQLKLDQVAQALLAIPARNLIVEGYTDSQGSDAYNQDLSQRRADAVRNYLVDKGYSANRVQAHGRGKVNPIANNNSAEGRANNRRVEIVIEREVVSSK